MRPAIILVIFVTAIFALGQTRAASRPPNKEMLAKDINGYALGMTMDEVVAVAHKPLEHLGSRDFKVTADGVNYDFDFSVLGHLYRITSDQNIGTFVPDEAYCKTLSSKMTKKFGIPYGYEFPMCQVRWGYSELVPSSTGPLSVPTVQISARVIETNPIQLELFLIDWRIARRDAEKANEVPRAKAEDATKF